MSTAARIARIRQSIAECDRFIAKEGPLDAALRPATVQSTLDHAHSHRAKLQAMLETLAAFRTVLFVDATHYVALGETCVTIGEFGGRSIAVPRGHAWFDRVAECDDELDFPAVRSYFNELSAAIA